VPRHASAGGGLVRTGPAKRIFSSCMLRFGGGRDQPRRPLFPLKGAIEWKRKDPGIAACRAARPWCTVRAWPAFEDMHASLRRVMITARISACSQASPAPRQIQEVLTAWHAAAA
jgi:hypothetical protein